MPRNQEFGDYPSGLPGKFSTRFKGPLVSTRRLFGDHQGGGIGIAAGDGWHDARIDYAQSCTHFDTQMRIQNRCGIVHLAHFYRANRVENCISDITGEPRQFFVALVLHPRL